MKRVPRGRRIYMLLYYIAIDCYEQDRNVQGNPKLCKIPPICVSSFNEKCDLYMFCLWPFPPLSDNCGMLCVTCIIKNETMEMKREYKKELHERANMGANRGPIRQKRRKMKQRFPGSEKASRLPETSR